MISRSRDLRALIAAVFLVLPMATAAWAQDCRGGAVPGSHAMCTLPPACDEICHDDIRQANRLWRDQQARIRADRARQQSIRAEQRRVWENQDRAARLNDQGVEAFHAGRFDTAKALFEQALVLWPGNTLMAENIRIANRSLAVQINNAANQDYIRTRFEAAEQGYKAAIALDPDSDAYRANLRYLGDWRHYRPSGNAFVGGTGWQLGYNVPPGLSAEARQRALEALREQSRLSGRQFAESVDLGRYNFAIGVAVSNTEWIDLLTRVQYDQWTSQPVPESGARGYNALRGRSFGELGCHSNGAMVCLLALMNGDVLAEDVVLYGPQITPQTMDIWHNLLRHHRIRTLTLYVSENDPITPTALLVNASPVSWLRGRRLLTDVGEVRSAIREMSDRMDIRTVPCGATMTSLDCHSMTNYTRYRGCAEPQYNLSTVPGTRVRGTRTIEPPSPSCAH